jgi:hypothetical protein
MRRDIPGYNTSFDVCLPCLPLPRPLVVVGVSLVERPTLEGHSLDHLSGADCPRDTFAPTWVIADPHDLPLLWLP